MEPSRFEPQAKSFQGWQGLCCLTRGADLPLCFNSDVSMGCCDGPSLPPTAPVGLDTVQCLPEIPARVLWVAPGPLTPLSTALPESFTAHGEKLSITACGNKPQAPPAAPQPGWMEIFSAYFKARHKVNQNKWWVCFGLWQSSCYRFSCCLSQTRAHLECALLLSQGGNVFIPNLEHLSHGGSSPVSH